VRTVAFTERNRSGNLLHVETPLGIVNIRIGLTDARRAPGQFDRGHPERVRGRARRHCGSGSAIPE